MPAFGAGSWMIGGAMSRDPHNDDQSQVEIIKSAISAGVRHIDTAEMYAAGHAETIIGRAIRGMDRSSLFIASKVSPQNLGGRDLRSSLEATLKRLGTKYLDLYYIHHPNPAIPLEATMDALNGAQIDGLIKNVGVSNFKLARLQHAMELSRFGIAAIQLHYNLIYREPEKEGLVTFCAENDVMLVAWRPVQKGSITSASNAIMLSMCEKYGVTPAQLAILWLISQKNVVTLSTMRSAAHLKENLEALDKRLSAEDIELLRSSYPDRKFVSDVPLK